MGLQSYFEKFNKKIKMDYEENSELAMMIYQALKALIKGAMLCLQE